MNDQNRNQQPNHQNNNKQQGHDDKNRNPQQQGGGDPSKQPHQGEQKPKTEQASHQGGGVRTDHQPQSPGARKE
jgi:hypothetical protein